MSGARPQERARLLPSDGVKREVTTMKPEFGSRRSGASDVRAMLAPAEAPQRAEPEAAAPGQRSAWNPWSALWIVISGARSDKVEPDK